MYVHSMTLLVGLVGESGLHELVIRAKLRTRELSDIVVIAAERSRLPRTQLHLTVADGEDWWFIVNDPDAVAAALRRAQDNGSA